MKLLTVILTFCAVGRLSYGQVPIAPNWNNNYPGYPLPIYQQGSQVAQPGQVNYQPYVPVPGVPVNIQQLGTQTPYPLNYQPGISGTNIQQLTQPGSTQPVFQAIPIGVGIPISMVQPGSFPVNQQFIPQIGYPTTPGPIKFPQ